MKTKYIIRPANKSQVKINEKFQKNFKRKKLQAKASQRSCVDLGKAK